MSTEENPDRPTVAGLILAAGSSSRMGFNKLLIEIDGEPLIHRMVQRAVAAKLEPLLVVVGHEQERIESVLRDTAARPVRHASHAQGMGSSLRAGIENVPHYCTGVLVLLGDMPLVTREMMETMVAEYQRRPSLVVSRYGDTLAPPILFPQNLWSEVLASEAWQTGKDVVKEHLSEATVVDWPDRLLLDLDRPSDVDRLEGSERAN